MTKPRPRLFGLLAVLCVAGLATAGIAGIVTDSSSAAKKRCRTVVKKSRGKAKRTRVCTAVQRTSPKPKPKPKPKPAPAGADLAVAATIAPEEVVAGAPVVYRVTVVNLGPKPAKNVVLAIEAAVGVDEVRPDPSGGSCDSPGKGPTAFRCRVGALDVQAGWTVEVQGTPEEEGTIRFAAAARSATSDPSARNSATQDEVDVKPAELPPASGEPPAPPLGP